MSSAPKALIILGIAALPVLAKLIDVVASSSGQIAKTVQTTPKVAKDVTRAATITNPPLSASKKEAPDITATNAIPQLKAAPISKAEFEAINSVRRIIGGEEKSTMQLELPPNLFAKQFNSECDSTELRNMIRSELNTFKASEDFTNYANLKAQNKISDIFSARIASFNPVSVDAQFIENDLTFSIELPCGIESYSISLTNNNWGSFESKGLRERKGSKDPK